MGDILSTSNHHDDGENGEGQGVVSGSGYRYPPKAGSNYFSNHFIMGGEKFESPQPESFLFGENHDLNFLGSKPVPFPYPPPAAPSEPTKTLRSLVNIRRDSLHFVLASDDNDDAVSATAEEGEEVEEFPDEDDEDDDEDDVDETTNSVRRKDKQRKQRHEHNAKVRNKKRYNIEFTFDCDVDTAITIYYFCTEDINLQTATYAPSKPNFKSETFVYTKGAGKVFSQPNHIFHPGAYVSTQNLAGIDPETGAIPVVIQCVALDGETQSHTTMAVVETASDGKGYMLKPLKQKLFVDGLCYLLQEIYGLENKSVDDGQSYEEDVDDTGADCVVCMCELRDTIILPCRHLCLCFACADSLRFQANNCPICRAPFRALLQIRAVQRISHTAHPALAGTEPVPQEGVPPGYTAISLVDALNGPTAGQQQSAPPPVMQLAKKKRKSSKTKSVSPSNPPSATAAVAASLEVVDENVAPNETSLDLVEEELAKMAVAESLTDLDASKDKEDNRDDEDDDEDDEDTVVVAIQARKTLLGAQNSKRSSQDSGSSTKRLLPKSPSATVQESASSTSTPSEDTELTIVPTSAAKVVNVAPKEENC